MPAKPALQTKREVGKAAREYIRNERRLETIKISKNAAIDKIATKSARRSGPIEARQEELFALIQAWGEANRGDSKTIKLPGGRELKWRLPSSPRLLVDETKIARIARLLMRFPQHMKYIEIRLKKNNIKADLEELHTVPGLRKALRLDDTEYFHIS